MTPFVEYLVKSSLSLALFFSVYKLLMSREKQFKLNRFLLLGMLVASVVLPFLDVSVFEHTPVIRPVEVVRNLINMPLVEDELPEVSPANSAIVIEPGISSIWIIYLLAISFFILRLLFSLSRVAQLVHSGRRQNYRKLILSVVHEMVQPFSFFRTIVLSESDYEQNADEIVTHEQEHIRQGHFFDLLVCEIYTVLHWFNPFAWLVRRELRLVHEYQADQAVIHTGIDATKYQLLVLKKAVGERRFAMANNFTQCPISKRLKMMNRNNRNRWAPIKLILFVPLGMLLLQAFSKPNFVSELSSSIVPVLVNQDDSTKQWLEKWRNTKFELVKFPALKKADAGSSKFFLGEMQMEKRNAFIVLLNKEGKLLVENNFVPNDGLTKVVKTFIEGQHPFGKENPSFITRELPLVGNTRINQGVVVFQHADITLKSAIETTLNSIGEAYLLMRKEISQAKFGEAYFSLNSEKRAAIDQAVPVRVSIAEPKKLVNSNSKQKGELPPPPPVCGVDVLPGKITVMGKECSLEGMKDQVKGYIDKYGDKTLIYVKIGVGTSDSRVAEVKKQLEDYKTVKIKYSSDLKEKEGKNLQ